MLLYNKKGELTTTQIVGLVVLILSFVIILFLIFQLNLGETTKKEVCRDSVILKGRSLLPTGATPLNCRTEYVCFSKTKSCDVEGYERVIQVGSKNGFYRAIADQMADCWWMFGEGKINYVGNDWLSEIHCSLCSTVYFDSSIKDFFEGKDTFSQKELYDFITTQKMSEKSLEYDEYLYGINFSKGSNLIDYFKPEGTSMDFMTVNLSKPSLIMMGIKSDTSTWTYVGAGVGVALATVLTGGLALYGLGLASGVAGTVLTVAAVAIVKSATVLVIAGAVGATGGLIFSGLSAKGESGNDFIRPILIEKDSQYFDAFKCKAVETRS